MKIKCDYCGSFISDTEEKCPNCGAVNNHLQRNTMAAPKTIEELKQWYKDRNLPPEETTRFFIGKNYEKPRAFGIYKDETSGNFVVYKNKNDGSRAIRYEGKDEAYAVNELYLKLKDEILNQKANNLNRKSTSSKKLSKKEKIKYGVAGAAITGILGLGIIGAINTPSRGYYTYNDNYYYYQNGSWYEYDDVFGWDEADYVPDSLKDDFRDYYDSNGSASDYGIDSFESSDFYVEPSSSSSSDSSSDWSSSDSWDSGSTDFSSDW